MKVIQIDYYSFRNRCDRPIKTFGIFSFSKNLRTLDLSIIIIFLSISLSGCINISHPSNKDNKQTETNSSSSTINGITKPTSLTSVIPTFTIQPSYTQIPIQLPTATPEITRVDEFDLHPVFIESVLNEYKGVNISTTFITDGCLSPMVKKIYINHNFKNSYGEKSEVAISHFTARLFFNIWWSNGIEKHEGPKTEEEFDQFMELWARAQQMNDPKDWEKVQFMVKGVNDLNDGNGYKKDNIVVWPMFSGNTPEGIVGIKEFNIAFVRNNAGIKNMITFNQGGWDVSLGTNLNNDILFSYVQLETSMGPIKYQNLNRRISLLTGWITNLNGNLESSDTKKILMTKKGSSYIGALAIEQE
jgi:hypothetical protein